MVSLWMNLVSPPFIATLSVQEKSIAGNRAFVSLDGALSTLHHFPILIQVHPKALQIGAQPTPPPTPPPLSATPVLPLIVSRESLPPAL